MPSTDEGRTVDGMATGRISSRSFKEVESFDVFFDGFQFLLD